METKKKYFPGKSKNKKLERNKKYKTVLRQYSFVNEIQ